jgi:hypothetical protein
MSITCFLHSYGVNHYESILKEYLDRGSDFFNMCDNLIVTYGGSKPTNIHPKANLIKLEVADEIYTMNIIHKHCKSNLNDKICYLHTKGVTNDNQCITEWRKYMFYFGCIKYNDRLEELKSNDTCGVDLRTTPVLHYSGNFWWANANYISGLNEPNKTYSPLSERHKSEFWVTSKTDARHHSTHDCGINVYERHLHSYPEEKYK